MEVDERQVGDVVVLDLDRPATLPAGDDIYSRLVFAAGRECVETVVIDGHIVVDEGVMLTLDRKRVIEDACEHAEALARRVG